MTPWGHLAGFIGLVIGYLTLLAGWWVRMEQVPFFWFPGLLLVGAVGLNIVSSPRREMHEGEIS